VPQVKVAVTGVVGLQIGGEAGPVEPGMMAVEERAAHTVVLGGPEDGQESQVVMGFQRGI
jgi:hypothetical protein